MSTTVPQKILEIDTGIHSPEARIRVGVVVYHPGAHSHQKLVVGLGFGITIQGAVTKLIMIRIIVIQKNTNCDNYHDPRSPTDSRFSVNTMDSTLPSRCKHLTPYFEPAFFELL